MKVKYSNQLDTAFCAALQRNYDVASNLPDTWAGDGINEIDVVGEIVTAVRKAPSNSPIFVLEGDDPSQMAFFVGTQAQILAKLNAVQ
tara:strand:+ start:336 stop:599 length:264 start_codon:yes stop_codon:yes gene_type:complete